MSRYKKATGKFVGSGYGFPAFPIFFRCHTKSPAENGGKIAGAFESGMQGNLQNGMCTAGKEIGSLHDAVLVDVGNRCCVKAGFEKSAKILWIHIEYGGKVGKPDSGIIVILNIT